MLNLLLFYTIIPARNLDTMFSLYNPYTTHLETVIKKLKNGVDI